MIEIGRGPARGRMTGPAIRAILAVVFIILSVARITIRWRAFENVIGVALCALHADVRAG
jgi:uncharacterized membrane protein (Fun14 family)